MKKKIRNNDEDWGTRERKEKKKLRYKNRFLLLKMMGWCGRRIKVEENWF